ncbi:hypothetical protein JNUCC0626_43485 [Lentzea sp. JNUCC 0626]|uniref:hypothetical protein n=1 Tax=Lentzea sp. JNUCC 0626 TaxID=3367513 RepID=UPI003747B71D
MAESEEDSEWLRLAMEFTLARLVRRSDFEFEIKRLALNPEMVKIRVALDPAVRASARRACEPMTNRTRAAAVHRAGMPPLWPSKWNFTLPQRHALQAAAAILLSWLLVVELLGYWLPGVVQTIGWFAICASVWFLAWYGLPPTVGQWIRWAGTQARLVFWIPTGLAKQHRELRDDVLVPELREWLHRQATPSFELAIRLRDASGLTMPPDLLPLVRTAAVDRCAHEVARLMPSAIGLAGTRGAGKTTIVERAVRGEFSDGPQHSMLGIMTSAPVRYDARDFALHIHSRVCREVLNFLANAHESGGTETQREWRRLHRTQRLRASLADMARGGIQVMVLLGLAAGVYTLALPWHWSAFSDVEAARDAVARIALSAQADPIAVLHQLERRHAGLALCAALIVAALLTVVRRFIWRGTKGTMSLLWRWFRTRNAYIRPVPSHVALRKVAEQHLRRIRFLQTHTEGWSGKVSGPRGTDFGLSRSLARTEQPWTHPEVVARLREFLELVVDVLGAKPTGLSGIVIGIDELDKISDPDDAHRFLNEIKGIFGVNRCLFLVSVSDDALTAFERRGMPARDAFDSAFTTMINVQPFTLEESETWLAQRALGIPEPFVWLCHCLSGGLPRDLGRVAIALHDLDDQCTRLGDVTQALVRSDLTVKVRAFGHSAKRAARTDEDEPGQPHELIHDLQTVASTELVELEKLALHIWPEPDRPPRTELEHLRAEAACYLIFCQTLVEVFHDELSPSDLRHPGPPASAEHRGEAAGVVVLARARQHMAVDIPLARNTIGDFRAEMGARK